jgi:hypothetical protein
MRRAIPPLHQYAFMSWYLVKYRNRHVCTVVCQSKVVTVNHENLTDSTLVCNFFHGFYQSLQSNSDFSLTVTESCPIGRYMTSEVGTAS